MSTLNHSNTSQVKVVDVNMASKFAVIQMDDGSKEDLFMPYYFGGQFAPHPIVGDTLNIRRNGVSRDIIEAWKA